MPRVDSDALITSIETLVSSNSWNPCSGGYCNCASVGRIRTVTCSSAALARIRSSCDPNSAALHSLFISTASAITMMNRLRRSSSTSCRWIRAETAAPTPSSASAGSPPSSRA